MTSFLDPAVALREVTARAHAAEQRLGVLAQLVAMLAELHSAPDAHAVCTTIKETVANLIGCEQMGIYRAITPGPILALVDEIGLDPVLFATLPATLPPVAAALGRGGLSTIEDAPTTDRHAGTPLTACIPLKRGTRVFGAIVLFRLLVQKPVLEPSDRLVLSLLGEHASLALARHLDIDTWGGLVG